MFELVKFKYEHLVPLLDQPANETYKKDFTEGLGTWMETNQNAFTGLVNGKVAVCGGVIPYWTGRGFVWTIFDCNCKPDFLPVFRGIKRFLADQKKIFNRIEVAVPCDFEIGRRRAKLLGFELDCERAKKFLADGTDCALYSMVRGET